VTFGKTMGHWGGTLDIGDRPKKEGKKEGKKEKKI
jgi:hypothetical protein